MEIKVTSISDKGILSDERIGLLVLKDCQLKYNVLVKTKRNAPSGFSNKGDAFFWFVPQEAKENDKIVVYTKQGINSVKENEDGSTTYFYFWGLSQPIFTGRDDDDNLLVHLETRSWRISS